MSTSAVFLFREIVEFSFAVKSGSNVDTGDILTSQESLLNDEYRDARAAFLHGNSALNSVFPHGVLSMFHNADEKAFDSSLQPLRTSNSFSTNAPDRHLAGVVGADNNTRNNDSPSPDHQSHESATLPPVAPRKLLTGSPRKKILYAAFGTTNTAKYGGESQQSVSTPRKQRKAKINDNDNRSCRFCFPREPFADSPDQYGTCSKKTRTHDEDESQPKGLRKVGEELPGEMREVLAKLFPLRHSARDSSVDFCANDSKQKRNDRLYKTFFVGSQLLRHLGSPLLALLLGLAQIGHILVANVDQVKRYYRVKYYNAAQVLAEAEKLTFLYLSNRANKRRIARELQHQANEMESEKNKWESSEREKQQAVDEQRALADHTYVGFS